MAEYGPQTVHREKCMSEESSGTAVLIDVSDLPLDDLPALGNARLRRALEQLVARNGEAVAAFNSAM
ncbi:FxSxx-COOH cyclophane-containing RiPP peptide [Nonomuraea sp. NPDC050691]|uniref:FxSxx-COOH cyclophane-containing RiPP peptide n=1 Tax=Nonomuraea sp. NPDC050691 TaxID=3155661 RepID=UPI0033D8383A